MQAEEPDTRRTYSSVRNHRHVHGVKVILLVSLFTLIVDVKGDYFLAARDLMMPITVLLPTRIMSSKGR